MKLELGYSNNLIPEDARGIGAVRIWGGTGGTVQLNRGDSTDAGVGKMPCVGGVRSGRGCIVAVNIRKERS